LRDTLKNTKIVLMYGLTEAFRSTYLPPEELDRRPTSMGKAIPDTEILVINEEGRLCTPGEVGELVHRGPTVSLGYWNRPEDTARALRPNPLLPAEMGDCEKVCYSGDLVKTDEDGFLYFLGRRDTMIKSSGFRISPTEVEEVLYQSRKLRAAFESGQDAMRRSLELANATMVDRKLDNGTTLRTACCFGYSSEVAAQLYKGQTHTVVALFDLRSQGVSLRRSSDSEVDLSVLAQHFGGGGHAAASGLMIPDLRRVPAERLAEILGDQLEKPAT